MIEAKRKPITHILKALCFIMLLAGCEVLVPGGKTITVNPDEVTLEQGQSVTVQVDMANVPEDVILGEYAIDLPESLAKITIETEPCSAGDGSVFCENWRITAQADTVPAVYDVSITILRSDLKYYKGEFKIRVLPSGGNTPALPAVAVAAGHNHSLALLEDGSVWAWGHGQSGQLGIGIGEINDEHDTGEYKSGWDVLVPVQVLDITYDVVSVAAGAYHSLVLLQDEDSTAMAWGSNTWGQLGMGASSSRSRIPVPVDDLKNIQSIAAGPFNSVALLENGTVKVWGQDMRFYPTFDGYGEYEGIEWNSVRGAIDVPEMTGVKAVCAGSYGNAFALFLREDGTVWVWGKGNAEIDQGNTDDFLDDKMIPRQITGFPGSVRAMAGAKGNSLFLLDDGTVWRWTGSANHTPEQVPGLSGVKAISKVSSANFSSLNADCYFILADDTVWHFDSNDQLVQKAGLTDVQSVVGGQGHTLVLLNNCLSGGTLRSWGTNASGQLGNPDYISTEWPVPVVGIGGLGVCEGAIPPTADFTASPLPAEVGGPVKFNASASTDSDGTIVNYAWDFDGDGTVDAEGDARSFKITHKTYNVGETYEVWLQVMDNVGLTDDTTMEVEVRGGYYSPAY